MLIKYDIRITKGVFPGGDGMQPGLDWIDHGCGDYLFSREGALEKGKLLMDLLTNAGIENYWSYTDVWENPTRDLNVWQRKRSLNAVSNFLSFIWRQKRMSVPLLLYYGASVPKNLLGPTHVRYIIKTPWKSSVWRRVAWHGRRLMYYHANPMVLYDSNGHFGPMSNRNPCIFDTTLLNHLAFQLRPSNVELLCRQNGLLLAHCYFNHQKGRYGTINCFANRGDRTRLIPDFINNMEYISQKQNEKDLITLPFHALRLALTNFANTSLIRTLNGWETHGPGAIVASRQPMAVSKQTRQWCKNGLYFTEVNGQVLLF
jgi:hypothetical protein